MFTKPLLYLLLLLKFAFFMPICYSKDLSDQSAQLRLQQIPDQDKEDLSLFFESLIRLEGFGYTIFGNKPVTQAGCWITPATNDFYFDKVKVYKKGQELCEKYSSFFKTNNLIIRFEACGNWYGIYIINKNNFLTTIDQNLRLFKQVLGETTTSQKIFQKLETKDKSFSEILNNDECLLGILFGYGTKNSIMFKRKTEIAQILQAHFSIFSSLPENQQFVLHHCKSIERLDLSDDEIKKYIQEYDRINETLTPSSQNAKITDLFPEVGFLCDMTDEETQNILNHYRETQLLIRKAFENEVLEAVLCKFNER